MRLLLDENLSPKVAVALRADGYDVAHLRERGRLGLSDPEVFALAWAEDRVLVTANIADFRKLATASELHTGMILLSGGLRRDEQLEVLRRTLTGLEGVDHLINQAVTVEPDGALRFEEIPKTGP